MKESKILPACDYCGSPVNVKEILYGMPSDDFDESKYSIGGCLPGVEKWICESCGR